MDRQTRKNHKKRPAPVSYRPPEKFRDEFHERAKASGLSINAFITHCIFERGRSQKQADNKNAALLLSQAARINSHLEEIEHSPPDGRHSLLLKECRNELAEIRMALLNTMGRRP